MKDKKITSSLASKVHTWTVRILLLIMIIECILLVVEQQWLSALMVFLTIAIVISPEILSKRFDVTIPVEFQILVIVFVFAALFLGEVGTSTHASGGGIFCCMQAPAFSWVLSVFFSSMFSTSISELTSICSRASSPCLPLFLLWLPVRSGKSSSSAWTRYLGPTCKNPCLEILQA